MKFTFAMRRVRTVALFGRARLVKDGTGRFELQGGTPADQCEAKEWISLFMHEAVPLVETPMVIDGQKIAG